MILATDVTRKDSEGDISGIVELWVGRTHVGSILVDHDPLRLEFYGDDAGPVGAALRPTVVPETFLDWLESEATEPFAVAGRVVARRSRGRVVFGEPDRLRGRPKAGLTRFRQAFRRHLDHAISWRQDAWIGAPP